MKQFVSRRTPEEMAAESKKATEEGLKAVAEALGKIDEEYDSDNSLEYKREYRHTDPNRYLQLELANAKIEVADLTGQLNDLKAKFELLKKIDNELSYLNGLGFYTKDINALTLEQVEKKLVLYKEEEREHSNLCMNYITKMDMPYIKRSMSLMVISTAKKNMSIAEQLNDTINKKWWANEIEVWSTRFGIALLIVLVSIVWAQKIEVAAAD